MIHKYHVFLFSLLLIAIFIFVASPAKPTQAEIATQRDWIGIFEVQAPGSETHTQAATANGGTDWRYTGNEPTYLCPLPTPGNSSSRPWLAGGCTLSQPGPYGAYEFRLYANDNETEFGWLAQSKVVWVQFGVSAHTNCNRSLTPYYVTLSWPALVGIATGASSQSIDIYETVTNDLGVVIQTRENPINPIAKLNGNVPPLPYTYTRSPLTRDYTYTYEVVPRNRRNNQPYPSSSNTNKVDFTCSIPYLQTSGGDVHSNR